MRTHIDAYAEPQSDRSPGVQDPSDQSNIRFKTFWSQTIVLFSGGEEVLDAGTHTWPFAMKIPDTFTAVNRSFFGGSAEGGKVFDFPPFMQDDALPFGLHYALQSRVRRGFMKEGKMYVPRAASG